MPGCAGTAAHGINNPGQIVGTCIQPSVTLGFLYSGGSFSPIEFPNATVTNPSGIDSAGRIAGSYAFEDGNLHGFLYVGGSFSTIDVPGATATRALGMDDVGQIVGAFTDSRGEHGFLYLGGSFTTLDAPGAVSTSATGIDNAGEIVGWFTDANSRVRGFRYAGGGYSSLDEPGGEPPGALAINGAGQIVGSYFDARGVSHGFLATPLAPASFTSGAFTTRPVEPVAASIANLTARVSSIPSPCDVAGSSATNVANLQFIINEALGVTAPNNDLNSDHVVNVTDIQVVINAVLQKGCTPTGTQGGTTVAHLTVQSGNGQVACICITASLQSFQPISVKATDINGNPVAGATVNWSVLSGQMTVAAPTSVTNSSGIATQGISLLVLNNFSSTSVPYYVSTVQASSNNASLIFTETESLITGQGASVIFANPPYFGGQLLSGVSVSANIGTTLSTPIQMQIAGTGVASNGVPNVSVRILNGQSSPALICTTGANYADPGSVLSDSQGNTSCYLTFSGSGTGVFYLLIGGVPGTNIGTALDLEAFGPFTFTSIGGAAGAPAAVQIVSGNNQVGGISQTLAPLVAKLVDAHGNAISGQTMSWSASPAGAASINNGSLVTDANGEVSTTVSLYSPALASAGVTITAALQSNPSVAATFNEAVSGALTAMTKISGDNQSAAVGATFTLPLVVQLVNASGPYAYFPLPIHYTVSGPVSLDTTSAYTDVNGQASVTATAGSSSGRATVTATVGAFTQTFTLTVIQ
jgi:probable HAF family extracellular repeat protein